jgi:hypothetical protein
MRIEDHEKKLFYYLINIENHILIVKNDWLQKHNS